MARDATGCCEGPDPHGRGVLRRAPKGPVPKLAAKTLTAPLFLAAVLRPPLRPPVVKSPGSVIFTCVGVEGPLKRGSHRGYFVRRNVSAIGYTLQPASLAQEQRS